MLLQLGLLDGQLIPDPKIDYAVRVLQEFLRSGSQKAGMVCCHTGRFRSPAIILACLLGSGLGFNEACNLIESRRQPTLSRW
jgi:protein-tyrosine phosphatase